MTVTICYRRGLEPAEAFALHLLSPGGIGIAWTENGTVFVRKFLDLGKFWGWYRRQVPLPHVIHFSSAVAAPEMAGPVPLLPTAPVVMEWIGEAPVLFHEGYWPLWGKAAKALEILGQKFGSEQQTAAAWVWYLGSTGVPLDEAIRTVREAGAGKIAVLLPSGEFVLSGLFFENGGVITSQPWLRDAVRSIQIISNQSQKGGR